MGGLQVTCDSCRRSWRLAAADSVYLQLAVASQPCPYCEAYTLGCHVLSNGHPGQGESAAACHKPQLPRAAGS